MGDEIRFEINSLVASVTSGGPVIWTGNGDLKDIVLTATAAGGAQTVSVTYEQGWNMISLPVTPADATFDVLFPDAVSAFEFDAGYQLATQLSPCVGYWLNAATGGTYQISGTAAGLCDVTLPVGWNMVGVPIGGTIADNVIQNPAANIVSMFAFSGGYQLRSGQDLLAEGNSFWFNLGSAGQLTLNSNTGGVAAKLASEVTSPPRRSVSRIIATAIGGEQTMFLGVAQEDLVALPPLPPKGLLDVRAQVAGMQTQHVPNSDQAADYRLGLQGTDLRLRWDIDAGDREHWKLIIDGQSIALTGRGSVEIDDTPLDARLRFTPTPSQFALANYPNPFNPTTTIRYRLDRDSDVSLTIYNLAGQVIRRLVTDYQVVGDYSATWDALDDAGVPVAAGVYVYTLETDSRRLVRKMVLLK